MTKTIRPILMDTEAIKLLKGYKKKENIRRTGDAIRKLLGLEPTGKKDKELEKIEKELNEILAQEDDIEGDTKDGSVKSDDPVYPPN